MSDTAVPVEPAVPVEEDELSWMVIGLFAFGGASGFVTGMSEHAGISQTLLTSLFTFAGGALLSYSGFMRRLNDGSSTATISMRKVGAGLLGFSAGVIAGVVIGLYVHVNPPASIVTAGKSGGWVLHGDANAAATCRDVARRAKSTDTSYAGAGGAAIAIKDLQWLSERVSCDELAK